MGWAGKPGPYHSSRRAPRCLSAGGPDGYAPGTMRIALLLFLAACSPDPAVDSDSPPDDTALDPAGDADGDGIDNGTELEQGSDPLDPSSAAAWHPEWTERPRLLTDPDGLERLPTLAAQEGEPWSSLLSRITSRCAAEPVEDDVTLSSSTTNGNIAFACAVSYALGDVDAGAKSASILEILPVEAEIDATTVFYTDLRAGRGLLQGARAYDLLLAVGYPDSHDPAAAHERLHQLGEFLWGFYVETYPQWMQYAQNNHATKLAATFGALGMGLPDDPRSARYVNYAVAELNRLHPVLHAADGGYAEGPSYLVYGMESELPFMAALDRWLGDATLPVMRVCDHDPDADCESVLEDQHSPLRDPLVCEGFERFAEHMMPAGYGPNTDDSNLASAHMGLVAGLCDSEAAAWAWDFQAATWHSAGSVELSADSILAWDTAPAGLAPELGPIARPDAGWAVLRDGWERDSAYALLQAEHGVARDGGGGHEHADTLAYLWAARGHYLLIDSGYGNWSDHNEVMDPEAHNIFLVGGEGPGTAEAFIDGVDTQGALQVATGHTAYEGMAWTRSVVLAGPDVLVVWDRVEPDGGGSLDLTLLTQGPTTGMALEGALAHWSIEDLELQLTVIADGEPVYSERIEEHAFSYSDYQDHSVLAAELTIDGPTRWLTVARVAEPGVDGGLELSETGVSWPGGEASLEGVVSVGEDGVELGG